MTLTVVVVFVKWFLYNRSTRNVVAKKRKELPMKMILDMSVLSTPPLKQKHP